MPDPFEPLGDRPRSKKLAGTAPDWTCVLPVPDEWEAKRPKAHPKLGEPTMQWAYRNEFGQVLGWVLRYDRPEGKEMRPLCLFRNVAGEHQWRWESWAEPRPLYGLHRLAEHPDAMVIVTEGEKAADAAAKLSGLPVVTSPAGAKSAAKANWQPLRGRQVIIWPDADAAGLAYAEAVAKLARLAGAKSIARISPPDGVVVGWDAADALADGWTGEQVEQLFASAAPIDAKGKAGAKADASERRRGPKQRDEIIAAADGAELWFSPSPQLQPYATVPVNGHKEHMRLDSLAFRRWLAGRYYEKTGAAPAGQMVADAMRVLEVKALQAEQHVPAMRTAWRDGACWIDLCDAKWRALRVTGTGWSIVEDVPVKFIRTETMAPLPDPEPGHLLEGELRAFINADDEDYRLIVGWALAALWGRSAQYPILALGGEQGSGKSTMAKMLQSLTDPCSIAGFSLPADQRELFTMAINCHVLSFDNVSKVDAWLSDALSRMSTGSGYLTRKLHSDAEAHTFTGARPIILNGIPALTERADLTDRTMTVRLRTIDETTRRPESEWQEDWERARPKILGALLDALSAAVRKFDQVKLSRMPRLADFAKLMAAAETALGFDEGAFLAAYFQNRSANSEAVFESDFVAVEIHKFMMGPRADGGSWEGTATMLLDLLSIDAGEEVKRAVTWPKKPNALGNALDRAAPALRHKGIAVTKRKRGDTRLIILTMLPAVGVPRAPANSG